jgi:hypothetical protein
LFIRALFSLPGKVNILIVLLKIPIDVTFLPYRQQLSNFSLCQNPFRGAGVKVFKLEVNYCLGADWLRTHQSIVKWVDKIDHISGIDRPSTGLYGIGIEIYVWCGGCFFQLVLLHTSKVLSVKTI